MSNYICIHGHFYQPPRENPWLEAIEIQDSAYPYHDWNERITAECYAPNTASRVLDEDGLVADISKNYSHISFNFGPTLLSWMEFAAPAAYDAVLQADRESMERFSGHGSAMAQAYNHLIMPLSNKRDRWTQVLWGIRDFEHRFKRKPEGMWLPETAVDSETLEALAAQDIKFTVLAPRQAWRVRRTGETQWQDATDEKVDPSRPYLCKLKSGREITLFFYDGAISRDIAFNNLLDNGKFLADRLTDAVPDSPDHDPLVHVATDGETYGHHHRFGDMALAAALNELDSNPDVQVTIYGEYLEKHPPEFEAQIAESSSWSCVHGVERWKSDCGCNTGGHGDWNQAWRDPLRQALDWLRDTVNPMYEKAGAELFKDSWKARDEYIGVILDRSDENVAGFLSDQLKVEPDHENSMRAIKLLELQRHLMLIYTSCGWFFDEVSSVEPVQVIEYAGRAVQLTHDLFDTDVEAEFIERLSAAKSNIPENKDAGEIYRRWVQPQKVDLRSVAAHSAMTLLFNGDESIETAFDVEVSDQLRSDIGRVSFVAGMINVKSCITLECGEYRFATLSMGDHNISCGIHDAGDGMEMDAFMAEFAEALQIGDVPGLVRSMDKVFGESQFSLRNLFRDQQRRILNYILQSATEGAEGIYQALYEQQAPVIRFLRQLGNPVPQAFQVAVEYFVNAIIRRELERNDGSVDFPWLQARLEEARMLQVALDGRGLGLLLEKVIHRMLEEFREGPADVTALEQLEAAVDIASNSPLEVDLWDAQTATFQMAHAEYLRAVKYAEEGNEDREQWAELFRSLASNVSVKLP